MKHRNVVMKYGPGAALAALSFNAMATTSYLPADVSSGYAQMTTDFGALIALVWPLVALVAFTFLAVKLFKRGTGKV